MSSGASFLTKAPNPDFFPKMAAAPSVESQPTFSVQFKRFIKKIVDEVVNIDCLDSG